MGDQFLALTKGRHRAPDTNRHFGLVVDDRAKVESLAANAGAVLLEGPFLDFLDPWGNRIEVVTPPGRNLACHLLLGQLK